MKDNEKASLLFRIADAFGKGHDKDADPARFDSATRSLYAQAPDSSHAAVTVDNGHQPEIVLEEKDYQDAVNGDRAFVVMKDVNCYLGKTLVIRETKNFIPTGRILSKTITCIERNNGFLKEGYCIVCWKQ